MLSKVPVVVLGAVLLFSGTYVSRNAQCITDDPRLLMAAAQFKFATGDVQSAERLLSRISAKTQRIAEPQPLKHSDCPSSRVRG